MADDASAPGFPDHTAAAVVLDWDGTAVTDRRAPATAVRRRLERLCATGVQVAVVSGTHVGNIDGQLAARPQGPGRLHLCLNGGSEVFEVTGDGPALAWRRTATPDEDRALDRAAALTVERLRAAGLEARVVDMPPAPPAARAGPLNRRKIDLIPEPAWADPPRARIGELVDAVGHRLAATGLAGLAEVVATLGLVLVVLGTVRSGRIDLVALAVGGYIAAAYWFTSSTSFANPAVTVARMFSDTFAGIDPASAPLFVLMQIVGGALGLALVLLLFPTTRKVPA